MVLTEVLSFSFIYVSVTNVYVVPISMINVCKIYLNIEFSKSKPDSLQTNQDVFLGVHLKC